MSTLDDIWATLQAYRQVIGLLAMFFGPALLGRVLSFVRNGPRGPAQPLSRGLLAIVVLHGLYTLYSVLRPPYDLFSTHGLRIRTPTDALRPLLCSDVGIPPNQIDDHPLLALLLARMVSLDARYAYVRWGHATFIRCTWCADKTDYALAGIPNILAPFVLQALLIGIMGWQAIGGVRATERKTRFRSAAGWGLGAMLAADFGSRWLLDIRAGSGPKGDCIHLDAALHQIRAISLFLLTAAYAFWPLPNDARAAEASLLATLDAALHTMRLTSITRSAINRSPALKRISTELRDKRSRAEDVAHADAEVVAAAQGVGFMEGNEPSRRARSNAQEWIGTEWSRLVRRQ